MFLYLSSTQNPYFNIATEEYFLKNFDEGFFYLYINQPSIIVGKHQNTLAEINTAYAKEHQIPVVRRLSGGGTVFHDTGNLNYCFIEQGSQGHLVDFKKYAQPVLDVLNRLGIPAYLRGKSDLVIGDQKFSGNAEHVYKNRVLHHGTMLFSSALDQLNASIASDGGAFSDKAVRSNRSRVTNISEHLHEPLTIEDFIQLVVNRVTKIYPEMKPFHLSGKDQEQIEHLVATKYQTWDWVFAYSPPYEFMRSIKLPQGTLEVHLWVEKGNIRNATCLFNGQGLEQLTQVLIQQKHAYEVVKQSILPFFGPPQKLPFSIEDFTRCLF
ncbi:MAG TPA: lipoate--protein ligase [Marinilabiliales bacterium]|jgi:lipoate-protein ligase A|nr:MAG: hypothetical protein A2W95_07505 [Bacteroidetes bacterium GWA2_40_14]OFX59237.1 MAG: hypothetical protein A2W84_04015 [Bacteroidetes bacterium GWC2_40_13]OFX75369.1 MAG: hypothetical protein A2W96_19805 [Bacteroidetes bacterium GWD2_40_43]OFX90663.1 MAG: hypothetical protein A2W97_02725 [Bacteroidetes bacterium GWE2_40_63]OFY20859.1 MAG: hypothetical protein A2W88_17540 [Bacteroidetes bacterium GWF2_40_13]OFZ23720.1 MAG: hypothetical protein A2437_06710 [Bacteroidetes bacterium RIFOXYC